MKENKKVKKKINFKGFIFLILAIYLLGSFAYVVFTRPIKNIVVLGNNYVKDEEIIELAGIKDYPTIFKASVMNIKKNIKENYLIDDVTIKKSIFGKITIIVTENKPIFINSLTEKIVLSNEKEIDDDGSFIGLPILINYVPSNVYKELVSGFKKLDDQVIYKISEIEYSPDKNDVVVFDEYRFILKMNDGNIVHMNTPNIKKLNNYNEIYQEVGSPGTLYLDSNSSNYIFKSK